MQIPPYVIAPFARFLWCRHEEVRPDAVVPGGDGSGDGGGDGGGDGVGGQVVVAMVVVMVVVMVGRWWW